MAWCCLPARPRSSATSATGAAQLCLRFGNPSALHLQTFRPSSSHTGLQKPNIHGWLCLP